MKCGSPSRCEQLSGLLAVCWAVRLCGHRAVTPRAPPRQAASAGSRSHLLNRTGPETTLRCAGLCYGD